MQVRRRNKLDVLILLLVAVGGYAVLQHAQAVGDMLHGWFYTPSAAVVQLANDAGMNGEGKKLFYRFSPQIVDAATLDQKCGQGKLGCTEGRSIYILEASNQSEQDRNIVTAAHEMLHVAYSRLTPTERSTVGTEISTTLASESSDSVATRIKQQLQTYSQADYYNEAHSYIGSELPDAGPSLNAYYARYFLDRSKATKAYQASPEGVD